jgi:uncharacterized protein (TIGR00369 family)
MSMATPSFEERFNPKIADGMIRTNNDATSGLPHYLGVRFDAMTPGRLEATMQVPESVITPFGTMHGGAMAGFVDHVMGCVLYPLMAKGQWAATTEFKLNYLTAIRGGALEAVATVLSLTKRTAVVRVDVSAGDRLACVAQGTLLITDPSQGA